MIWNFLFFNRSLLCSLSCCSFWSSSLFGWFLWFSRIFFGFFHNCIYLNWLLRSLFNDFHGFFLFCNELMITHLLILLDFLFYLFFFFLVRFVCIFWFLLSWSSWFSLLLSINFPHIHIFLLFFYFCCFLFNFFNFFHLNILNFFLSLFWLYLRLI